MSCYMYMQFNAVKFFFFFHIDRNGTYEYEHVTDVYMIWIEPFTLKVLQSVILIFSLAFLSWQLDEAHTN